MWNDFKYLEFLTTFCKVQMNTKLFQQICLRLYGTRRRAAPAKLFIRYVSLLFTGLSEQFNGTDEYAKNLI